MDAALRTLTTARQTQSRALPSRFLTATPPSSSAEDLLVRLNVRTGDLARSIGGQDFRIAASSSRSEPDLMTGSLNVGPRS